MHTPYDLQINRKRMDLKALRGALARLNSAQNAVNGLVGNLNTNASHAQGCFQVGCSASNATTNINNALGEYSRRLSSSIASLESDISTLTNYKNSFIRQKQEELRRKAMEEVQ